MDCLIVFAKAPETGQVKTRLERDTPLTPADISFLYRAFLLDVLHAAAESGAEKIILDFTPPGQGEAMEEIALKKIHAGRLALAPQIGDTFPQRITASFARARAAGATSCVMIGSDSPTLRPALLDRAFTALKGNGGAVVGPSGEGGMYLIGLAPRVLPDFDWIFGGGAELLAFARWCAEHGVPLTLMEEVTDVDVAADLVTLVAHVGALKAAGGAYPRETAAAIGALKLDVASANGTRNKTVVKGG